MKSPAFWWRPPGAAAALLAPAALLYGAVAGRRLRQRGERVSVPVVCVGNVTVGGAGKTPTAIAIAAMLREAGRRPAFLTRGHGGRLAGPVVVDPDAHPFPAVGDEALLLARHAPTIVSRDRPAGVALALQAGADVVVMDDGLQNPSLAKDLRLAVFDAAVGIGNGRTLPAGPLRAPLASQWPLVDGAVVVGEGRPGDRIAAICAERDLPVLRARLVLDEGAIGRIAGRRVLAFAGIGRPAKFFDSLRAAGIAVAETRAFPDHHAFTAGDVAALARLAAAKDLLPVTTEKDAVRITGPDFDPATLPVTLRFEDPAGIAALLARLPA